MPRVRGTPVAGGDGDCFYLHLAGSPAWSLTHYPTTNELPRADLHCPLRFHLYRVARLPLADRAQLHVRARRRPVGSPALDPRAGVVHVRLVAVGLGPGDAVVQPVVLPRPGAERPEGVGRARRPAAARRGPAALEDLAVDGAHRGQADAEDAEVHLEGREEVRVDHGPREVRAQVEVVHGHDADDRDDGRHHADEEDGKQGDLGAGPRLQGPDRPDGQGEDSDVGDGVERPNRDEAGLLVAAVSIRDVWIIRFCKGRADEELFVC